MRDDQAQAHQDKDSGMAHSAVTVRADPLTATDSCPVPVPLRPWLLRQASHGDPVRRSPTHPGPAKWSRRRALGLIVGASAFLWALLLSGWSAL
ncbi:hypothetical protein ACFOON_13845 [Novosphingobium piscinae]|uniref:Uncharacterized protein n=1 Tax=Novosphingobium piscinae TaxID=1507448 RepID=A0A7X1FXM2_9SPHN|nr:hypothetical protein [Novosphingobium piscinae]MBC2668903.1 hypothetical protein [Novosphingobium piscinae]